jgi:hypothetical protein
VGTEADFREDLMSEVGRRWANGQLSQDAASPLAQRIQFILRWFHALYS